MFQYRFHPAKAVSFDGSTLTIDDERARRTVSLAKFNITPQGLLSAMAAPGEAQPEVRRLLHEFLVRGLIVEHHPELSTDARLSRSQGYLATLCNDPQRAQQRISNQRVLVLGVGGTGTVVIQHLVAAGVRDFVLLDHDKVELSNFNRQFLWRSSEVGASKLERTATWIEERAGNPAVTTIEQLLTSGDDVAQLLLDHPDVTVVASCIDTPAGAERLVVDAALRQGKPVMTGAVGVEFGHVGPLFIPEHRPCLACWYPETAAGSGVTPWSHGVTNTLIGALMAQRILEWVVDPTLVRQPARMTLEFGSLDVKSTPAPDCGHA